MSPRPLTAAALFLLAGCSDAEHGHDHDPEAGHEHATTAEAPAATAPVAPTPATVEGPSEFALGGWTARIEPTATGLKLTAKDAGGAAVVPAGEARVVLTGTGQEEQRVVLAPADGGWSGAAKAAGATGYVAVVSLDVDGHTETARVTWGAVPAAAPAPKAEDHPHEDGAQGDGHEHGHGH